MVLFQIRSVSHTKCTMQLDSPRKISFSSHLSARMTDHQMIYHFTGSTPDFAFSLGRANRCARSLSLVAFRPQSSQPFLDSSRYAFVPETLLGSDNSDCANSRGIAPREQHLVKVGGEVGLVKNQAVAFGLAENAAPNTRPATKVPARYTPSTQASFYGASVDFLETEIIRD